MKFKLLFWDQAEIMAVSVDFVYYFLNDQLKDAIV